MRILFSSFFPLAQIGFLFSSKLWKQDRLADFHHAELSSFSWYSHTVTVKLDVWITSTRIGISPQPIRVSRS
jgi:hypothetical protein